MGLRNLSLCVMQHDTTTSSTTGYFQVLLWGVYDVFAQGSECGMRCSHLTRKGTVCGRRCTYGSKDVQDGQKYACKVHRDERMVELLHRARKRVTDYTLQETALAVLAKVDAVLREGAVLERVCRAVIELQPRVNNRMKFISHIIFGHLAGELPAAVPVRFIRASEKLSGRGYDGPVSDGSHIKSAYTRRKWLGQQQVWWLLDHRFRPEEALRWKGFLTGLSQQHDACDTALFCVAVLSRRSAP